MKVNYPITLDVKKTNVQKIIHANQGEGYDRELCFTLVSGNEKLNITPENTIYIKGRKDDDTIIDNSCTVKDGKVYYYLTPQNLAVVGDVDCQLVIVSDGVTYSAKFVIDVQEGTVTDEEIESSDEFSQLIELIQTVGKGKIYFGSATPGTDPENYPLVKEDDVYLKISASTKMTIYKAASVSTTVTWSTLCEVYTASAIDTILASYYLKSEVDTLLAAKQDQLSTEGHLILTGGTLKNTASKNYDADEFTDGVPSNDPTDYYELPEEGDLALNVSYAPTGTNTRMWVCKNVSEETIEWAEMLFHDTALHNGTSNPPTIMYSSHYPYDEGDFYLKTTTVGQDTTYDLFYLAKVIIIGSNPPYNFNLIWLNLSDKYTKSQVNTLLAAKQDELTFGDGLDNTSNTVKVDLDSNGLLSFSSGKLCLLASTVGMSQDVRTALAIHVSGTDDKALASREYVDTELAKKQNNIDPSHKVDADNVDDSTSTNKFVSAAEKAAIGKEPEYELIKTIDISELSEPVSMIIVNEDEEGNAFAYDDFFIDAIGIKAGANNCKLVQALYGGGSNQLVFSRSNTLGTTAKSVQTEFNRKTIDAWTYSMGGDYSAQNGGKVTRSAYTDKISRINILTDSAGFTEGVFKIYGKVKY